MDLCDTVAIPPRNYPTLVCYHSERQGFSYTSQVVYFHWCWGGGLAHVPTLELVCQYMVRTLPLFPLGSPVSPPPPHIKTRAAQMR